MALHPTDPVYCYFPHLLRSRIKLFRDLFPGKVMFAVKCNPEPSILLDIYAAGIHNFDTASLQEISQVNEWLPGANCHFMHPVKPRPAIVTAYHQYNVEDYVVDSLDEIQKLQQEIGECQQIRIFVRLETLDFGAAYKLSGKFGCTIPEAAELLKYCQAQGIRTGLAFHVGSQCPTLTAYESALQRVEEIIKLAEYVPEILDIGGGFPAPYANADVSDLSECLHYVAGLLHRMAEKYPSMSFICEPGRALVSSAMSVVCQVNLRKQNKLYLNDGIYGNLSESITGDVQFPVRWFGQKQADLQAYTLYGPTCDSLDVLAHQYYLPSDMKEGDLLVFDEVGAYSNANTTSFNGFITENWVAISDQAAMYHPGYYPGDDTGETWESEDALFEPPSQVRGGVRE